MSRLIGPQACRYLIEMPVTFSLRNCFDRAVMEGERAMYRQIQTDRSKTPLGLFQSGAQRITVGPYGYLPSSKQCGPCCVFNGILREAGSGGYLLGNGYRFFSATLMRFFTPDLWSPFGRGGINAYAYCINDPVNGSDPSGQFWVPKPGSLFRWEVPPKVRGSAEANAFEQAYSSFENLNWRQRLLTDRGRSTAALEDYIKLDAQKEALLADLGVFIADARRTFEGQSFQWRGMESMRDNARNLARKSAKQRSRLRVATVRDDPVEAWHRRHLFQCLPDTDSLA